MFCERIKELQKEKKPIVYIDESGFAEDMPRTHGYAQKGKRCYGQKDWGAKGRTNAIGAIIGNTIIAIGLMIGPVNTEVFITGITKRKRNCDG